MADFVYQDLFPLGADDTPYRKLTSDFVSTAKLGDKSVLTVEAEGLRHLAGKAMREVAHLLRPGHLAQLRAILDDPEASDNDRFVALELLKNANVAADELAAYIFQSIRNIGEMPLNLLLQGHLNFPELYGLKQAV